MLITLTHQQSMMFIPLTVLKQGCSFLYTLNNKDVHSFKPSITMMVFPLIIQLQ